MAQLLLRNVVKEFSGKRVVQGVNLQIADGEFVALVGPSGCGKSTTLRMIAGLEEITDGDIVIGDRVVNDVEPRDRQIAMVFQSYALYPHMTVRENIGFGLKLRGMNKALIRERVDRAARLLELSELLDRKPQALSGGQRQRVAMGRAMVREPEVFLFDEPLSNLDAQLRGHMRTEIKRMHQTAGRTTVYVTHDQVEAMTLADRIVVMRHGLVEQVASPQELYSSPATRFVAGFIGIPAMNFLPVRIVDSDQGLVASMEDGPAFPIPQGRQLRYAPYKNREMLLGLRPEHIEQADEGPAPPASFDFSGRVSLVEPLGSETLVHFKLGSVTLCAKLGPFVGARVDEPLPLRALMNEMHLFDPVTEGAV